MNYIATIIIILTFSLKIQAQGGESKWISLPSYKIKVSDEVFEDAEEHNILTDRIVISFIRNEKCIIENYEVKQGKLKSFSEWAKNDSENIIREWEKNNPCKDNEKKKCKFANSNKSLIVSKLIVYLKNFHKTKIKAVAQQRFAKIGVLVLNLHIVLYFCGQ